MSRIIGGGRYFSASEMKRDIRWRDALISELETENKALRADAERYRWLRSRNPDFSYCVQCGVYALNSTVGEDLDVAIDAERRGDG